MTDFDYTQYMLELASRKEDSSASNSHRNVKCPKCDTIQSATHKKCSSCGHDLTKARAGKFAKLNAGFDAAEYKRLLLAADSLAKASTPDPIGSPTGPGLWKHKGMELPPYIQHIAKALMRSGHPESEAIEMAVGIVKSPPHNWGPEARAAAAKAAAEWEAKKAQAHAESAAKKAA